MSHELINRNPDLCRLRDEGYEIDIQHGFLVLESVPYVNTRREICRGRLVSELTLNGECTKRPDNHQVWFVGEAPCKVDGKPLEVLSLAKTPRTLFPGCDASYRFSNKPQGGYANYFDKMTRYADIIVHQAQAIDADVRVQTYKPIPASGGDSVFHYTDSASSRAGIANLSLKLAMRRVDVIGLGGSGAYVFDFLTKTPVRELHLFDGDHFLQHNAFRAPGAASIEELEENLHKVEYYARKYGVMRRGVIPHRIYLDEDSVSELSGSDFVFVCVDQPAVRRIIFNFLQREGIPFIDVGMNMSLVEGEETLIGTCRATLSTPDQWDHIEKFVSFEGDAADDLYDENIQVAEMNAMNAIMAIIKWKKYCGYYQDCFQEHHSAYSINTNEMTRDALSEENVE